MSQNKAMLNYIYYKANDWKKNKSFMYSQIGNMNISEAYYENAKRLESNLNIPNVIKTDNFVKNVQSVLEIRKTKKDKIFLEQELQKIFIELTNFVQKDVAKTSLGTGLTVGKIGGGTKLDSSIKFSEVLAGFQKIKNNFDKFDSSFQNLGLSTVSIINQTGMEKTAAAYEQLNSFLKKYGGIDNFDNSMEQVYREIQKVCGALVGDFKGGLLEFGDYMYLKALSAVDTSINDAIINIQNPSLSGANMSFIPSEMAKQLNQYSFVNKSDNHVKIIYTENSITFEVDLGISDKSYTQGRAHGKNLATGISWIPTMGVGSNGLTETAFEYYYANLLIHESSFLQQNNNINQYLAAKASAFIISGIENASVPQAYFIRYANKIVYVPNLLRDMAMNKKKGLTIKPTIQKINNKFIDDKNATSIEDAYARTKNTIQAIRKNIKFNGSLM